VEVSGRFISPVVEVIVIRKLDIGRVGFVVKGRAGLACALWIAASVTLGGCASQPHATVALAPKHAPATAQAPVWRVAGPHVAPHIEMPGLEVPVFDRRGEGDLIQWGLGRCESEDPKATDPSIDMVAPDAEEPGESKCDRSQRVIATARQAAISG
jgi:hypothetical protein